MTATDLLNHFDINAVRCITYCEDDLENYCEFHETARVHDFLEKFGDRQVLDWKYWGDNFELEISLKI